MHADGKGAPWTRLANDAYGSISPVDHQRRLRGLVQMQRHHVGPGVVAGCIDDRLGPFNQYWIEVGVQDRFAIVHGTGEEVSTGANDGCVATARL